MVVVVLGATAGGCCDTAFVGEEVPPPEGANEAVESIHTSYQEMFVRGPVELGFRWTDSIRNSEGLNVQGWAARCGEIWIRVDPDDRTSDTAAAHEAAHCYAGHVGEHCGFADDSHSEAWIWGADGLVEQTNSNLASLDL